MRSGHAVSVVQVLGGHKNFQKDLHSLEICALSKGDPHCLRRQSVVAVSESGPHVARSSGAFGKPRNPADPLLDL